jgi:hypothetical protein
LTQSGMCHARQDDDTQQMKSVRHRVLLLLATTKGLQF